MFNQTIYPSEESAELPYLGIGSLNLIQAGQLIANCLWMEGEIEADVPENDSYAFDDPILIELLKDHALIYTNLLLSAVNKGSLKAGIIKRLIDDTIIPEKTYIDSDHLLDWLNERDIELGELFNDYIENESKILERACECISSSRMQRRLSPEILKIEATESILNDYRALIQKYSDLQKKYEAIIGNHEAVKPISEKQRGAYLNIIGALLGIILGRSPNGKPYSQFNSQQSVIDAIQANFGDKNGLSKRNLEEKFAEGKRSVGRVDDL